MACPAARRQIRGDISSQFLSGLLMAAPAAQSPVELVIDGPLVSQPYVRMTLAVMRSFGVDVETDRIAESVSHRRAAAVSARASTRSNPTPRRRATSGRRPRSPAAKVTVEGSRPTSLQGDVAFVDCLEQMGCEVRRDADSITVVGRDRCAASTST